MGVDVRHPDVTERRFALTDELAEQQVQRGLYVVERGERFAIPVDQVNNIQDFASGRFQPIDLLSFGGRDLWRRDEYGRIFRPGVEFESRKGNHDREALAWEILGYRPAMLRGNLFARHWHNGWANPFNPDQLDSPLELSFATLRDTHWKAHTCDLSMCPASIWPRWSDMLVQLIGFKGFVEDLGWLCGALVTDAFVSEIVDELVSTTGTEFADFDFHEVGTSSTAESNNQTALQASSGIARATGSPTDADPDYENVATVTADATESWEEHGIFNNSTGPTMMDRNLTGGIAVNSLDEVEFTYTLTVNPET